MKKINLPIGGNPITVPSDSAPVLTDLKIGDTIFKVNEAGDALDDSGKIIKTKAELEALKTTSIPPVSPANSEDPELVKKRTEIESQLIEGAEIELDGVNYKLDKDGNIIKDGKVVKTKADIVTMLLSEQDGGEPEDEDYINNIQKATNLVILDDKNTPITYENTLPGITQYVQDVHKNALALGANQFQENLYTQYPILKDVIEHLTLNGSLQGFTEEMDYSKVSISDDENQQIDIYTKAQLARGVSVSEINDLIKYLKEDKKLKVHAETALNYLKSQQTDKATTRARLIAEAKTREEQEIADYWKNIDTVLNSREVVINDKKFTLPEVIRVKEADGKIVTKSLKDFEDYVKKPLTFNINGKLYTMTQHDYDEYVEDTKRTPHHDLFEAFRRFSKYDDSQLIATNASSNVVKKVIKLQSKAGGGSGAAGKGGKIVLPIK